MHQPYQPCPFKAKAQQKDNYPEVVMKMPKNDQVVAKIQNGEILTVLEVDGEGIGAQGRMRWKETEGWIKMSNVIPVEAAAADVGMRPAPAGGGDVLVNVWNREEHIPDVFLWTKDKSSRIQVVNGTQVSLKSERAEGGELNVSWDSKDWTVKEHHLMRPYWLKNSSGQYMFISEDKNFFACPPEQRVLFEDHDGGVISRSGTFAGKYVRPDDAGRIMGDGTQPHKIYWDTGSMTIGVHTTVITRDSPVWIDDKGYFWANTASRGKPVTFSKEKVTLQKPSDRCPTKNDFFYQCRREIQLLAAGHTAPSRHTPHTPRRESPGQKRPAPEPEDSKIYMCCQQTLDAITKTKGLKRSAKSQTRASMPPFNCSKTPSVESDPEMISYNVPCFGPIVTQAVMRLFRSQEMHDLAAKMNIRIPEPTINTVVQSKLTHVYPLIQDLRTKGYSESAVVNLENFVKAAAELKPGDIGRQEDWTDIINKYCSVGWETKLHVDDILENFGFDSSVGPNYKGDTWKQALRWLSKTFECFGIQGSMCDVVNLVYAMRYDVDPGTPPIATVVEKVREFAPILDAIGPSEDRFLWIPTHIVLDCEVDDMLAFLLLAFIHQKRRTGFSLLVQLPPSDTYDSIDRQLAGLLGRVPGLLLNSTVFRDERSANADAVKLYWRL